MDNRKLLGSFVFSLILAGYVQSWVLPGDAGSVRFAGFWRKCGAVLTGGLMDYYDPEDVPELTEGRKLVEAEQLALRRLNEILAGVEPGMAVNLAMKVVGRAMVFATGTAAGFRESGHPKIAERFSKEVTRLRGAVEFVEQDLDPVRIPSNGGEFLTKAIQARGNGVLSANLLSDPRVASFFVWDVLHQGTAPYYSSLLKKAAEKASRLDKKKVANYLHAALWQLLRIARNADDSAKLRVQLERIVAFGGAILEFLHTLEYSDYDSAESVVAVIDIWVTQAQGALDYLDGRLTQAHWSLDDDGRVIYID